MFIRSDRKKLADGTPRTYISIAHNVLEETPSGRKRAKPVIFATLGIEEELDLDVVASMSAAFERYLKKRLARASPEERARLTGELGAMTKAAPSMRQGLRVLASRTYGLRVLIEAVWRQLGFDDAMRKIARQHDLSIDFERAVFAMVLNRIIDPSSKRACNEWLEDGVYFPEAAGWQVHHLYRVLDVLHQHHDEVQFALGRAAKERLSADDLDLLLMDTTSSWFEMNHDDVELATIDEEHAAADRGEGARPKVPRPQVVNDPPLRKRGHSKDFRPHKPQIVIGLVASPGGQVVSHEVYAGNTSDQSITTDLLAKSRAINELARPVVVMDSGMGGQPNLRAIDAMPGSPHRISGVPLRSLKFAEEQLLSRPGRWRAHSTKEHFTVRVRRFDSDKAPLGRAETWIATRNERERDRVLRRVERHIEQVSEILDADPTSKQARGLLHSRRLKRYVKEGAHGERVLLDRGRIRRERRLAGVKVVRTTLMDVDPERVLDAYQRLLDVENNFKVFKHPLALRPMHHRADRRIRAHVTLCVMALMCMREVERQTGRTWAQVAKAFKKMDAVNLEQGDRTFWQRSEWSAEATELLSAVDADPGPLTWDPPPGDGSKPTATASSSEGR
jgi:hypothetical protein